MKVLIQSKQIFCHTLLLLLPHPPSPILRIHRQNTRQCRHEDAGLNIWHEIIRSSLPEFREVIADISHGQGARYPLPDHRQFVRGDPHHSRQHHQQEIKDPAASNGVSNLQRCRAAGYLTLAAVAKCLQAATWLVARGNKWTWKRQRSR